MCSSFGFSSERSLERRGPAVAGAAALLVGLSGGLLERFGADASSEMIEADPIRIVQGIIIGISFIAGGTILRLPRKQQVEGLTTAASLLLTGAIGIAVALRQFVVAAGTTLLAVIVLRVIVSLEERIKRHMQ